MNGCTCEWNYPDHACPLHGKPMPMTDTCARLIVMLSSSGVSMVLNIMRWIPAHWWLVAQEEHDQRLMAVLARTPTPPPPSPLRRATMLGIVGTLGLMVIGTVIAWWYA